MGSPLDIHHPWPAEHATMTLFVGVMSGTSMDAVDVALVDLSQTIPQLQGAACTDWPPSLRERLRALAAGAPTGAAELALLDAEVGEFLASAVTDLLSAQNLRPDQVAAIGCHGQTVAHVPDDRYRTTLQLGDANRIAERTGITTVNDFRRRDMAAHGQGAPLAPAFHQAVLRSPDETRVVLNLGGIANVTVLPADPRQPAIGFDTGPANCLMDTWIRQQLGRPYDALGTWAASADPLPGLLASMRSDPYFDLAPPKSTGTQHFSANWLHKQLANAPNAQPAAVQATLLSLTVHTVADAVERHAADAARVLVCGGGAFNTALLERLEARLLRPVETTADYGIDPHWMEAMAFAWLAQQTLRGEAGNLPAVTGAAGPRVLGAIHPA